MPRRDGTGPQGQGAGSGKGRGNCKSGNSTLMTPLAEGANQARNKRSGKGNGGGQRRNSR